MAPNGSAGSRVEGRTAHELDCSFTQKSDGRPVETARVLF